MSSIRALPLNCSPATLKHNYIHDYDTCRPRCANTWASARNVLDTFTRSPVALSPPAHLKPTLRLTCPTCVSLLACVEASPLSPAYTAHLGPLPCITPYRVDGVSLSPRRNLSILTRPLQPPCAIYRRVYVCGSVVFRVRGQSDLAP